MILYQIAGVDPGEATADLRPILTEHARFFLQGGGQLALADWASLDELERAAFAAAGRRLRVEQAVRVGLAAQGDLAAMRVQAEVDGGQAHDEAALSAAVRAAKAATHGRA